MMSDEVWTAYFTPAQFSRHRLYDLLIPANARRGLAEDFDLIRSVMYVGAGSAWWQNTDDPRSATVWPQFNSAPSQAAPRGRAIRLPRSPLAFRSAQQRLAPM